MHLQLFHRFRPAARRILLVALALVLASGAAGAAVRSLPMAQAPAATVQRAAEQPPMRIAERFGVEPLAAMSDASVGAVDQIAAVTAWNRAGGLPVRIGFFRPLPLERTVVLNRALTESPAGVRSGGAYARAGAATVWGTAVRVENAYRLRLHLSDVRLPAGARLWVYAEDGETVGPFGRELVYQGEMLTPSVAGPVVYLEVELPEGALASGADYGFRVDKVAEIVRLGSEGEPLLQPGLQPRVGECLIDATCVNSSTFPAIDPVHAAIAHLEFPVGGGFIGLCTGGLLNTSAGGTGGAAPDPPLLTANHCLSDQATASDLDAFWDFTTATCNGTPPSLGSLPRTSGGTLLATGIVSDYTLVDMPFPAGRTLLGWNANASAVAPGTIIHRISHPLPQNTILAQTYTQYQVLAPADAAFQSCGTTPEGHQTDDVSKFLHLEPVMGGTFGGSSGAPSITGDGQVVGQLFAGCGPNPSDGCDATNNDIDGAFQTTFDHISRYLVGGNPSPPSNNWLTTAEQPGFEFQARITPDGGTPVIGAKESDCIAESICLSGALAGRPEVFAKIIGPRPNGFLWVQISRFTPSEVEVWVRQTATDQVNYYHLDSVGSGVDDVSGLQDRQAFSP